MSRQQREKQQRKQSMIDVAKQLFLEKGYQSVRMEEVAQQAEFTRRTIYAYFKSKIDLLVNIVMELFVEFEPTLQAAVNSTESPLEQIGAYGRAYYQFFKQELVYYQWVNYFDLAVHNEQEKLSETTLALLANPSSNWEGILQMIIEKGMKSGAFRSNLRSDLATSFFLKSLYGIVHQYIFHPQFPESFFYEELDYLISALKTK